MPAGRRSLTAAIAGEEYMPTTRPLGRRRRAVADKSGSLREPGRAVSAKCSLRSAHITRTRTQPIGDPEKQRSALSAAAHATPAGDLTPVMAPGPATNRCRGPRPTMLRVGPRSPSRRAQNALPGGVRYPRLVIAGRRGEVGRWLGGGGGRYPALARRFLAGLVSAVAAASGPLSNRACSSPAHGSPTSFIVRHAQHSSIGPFR